MRTLRTEKEIMQNWKGDISELWVSICCTTYNHEKYVEDALGGFLIQETDFPFEILIHDDASTDETADIIREYEAKYPNIIKPIYQIENQYSQGKKPNVEFNFPRAKGGYIAICEGDDYWTNSHKLQIQINEMLEHPECNISSHSAIVKYIDGSKPDKSIKRSKNGSKIFTTSEVILNGGDFLPTASLVMKNKVINLLPEWFVSKAPVGDEYLKIFGSLGGGLLYIDKAMCVYRRNIKGSWTQMIFNSTQKMKKHVQMQSQCFMLLNEFLDNRYIAEIRKKLSKVYLRYAIAALFLGDMETFVQYIEDSYKNCPNLTFKQKFFYVNRHNFNIVSGTCKLLLFYKKITQSFRKKVLS